MKKGLCRSVKRKGHELTIKHIEIEKVIIPISSYKGCTDYYPMPDRADSAIRTLDYFTRKNYTKHQRGCPLRYRWRSSYFSLKEKTFYVKAVGLSEINKIIDRVSTEDYR